MTVEIDYFYGAFIAFLLGLILLKLLTYHTLSAVNIDLRSLEFYRPSALSITVPLLIVCLLYDREKPHVYRFFNRLRRRIFHR